MNNRWEVQYFQLVFIPCSMIIGHTCMAPYTVWPEILAGIKFGGFVIFANFEDWRILIWRIGRAVISAWAGPGTAYRYLYRGVSRDVT